MSANTRPSPDLSSGAYRRRRKGPKTCHCCKKTVPFCWTCRCGFMMCQDCMYENFSRMSCNGITWQCPDCGELNGYGNQ
ncbi:hypothetical protein LJC22_06425 [Desulfosarcina sp. OttesenSCG-928-G10]|nr:hypothetical protein [Desulfosarcina sp. OttesenSCG-928-G10]MDL2321973.1 hypothetical protein [Desulfosarcina sp. OttesenSCG-928-B08]